VALLIDTENVSSQPIDQIVAEAEKLGMVTIRHLYGNWANNALRHWQNVMNQHSFEAIHNFPARQGKNATDIALVIGAMDLFYKQNITRFCIVTHDSDFVPLARRLRREGCEVWTMGGAFTAKELIKACSRFVYIEGLSPSPVPTTSAISVQIMQNMSANENDLDDALKMAYIRASLRSGNEWVTVQQLGSELKGIVPDFKARLGKKTLTKLIKEHKNLFEICDPLQGNHIEVRLHK
jgi:glutaredoxin-related protein